MVLFVTLYLYSVGATYRQNIKRKAKKKHKKKTKYLLGDERKRLAIDAIQHTTKRILNQNLTTNDENDESFMLFDKEECGPYNMELSLCL